MQKFFLASVLFFALAASACFSSNQTNQNETISPADETSFQITNPGVNLAKPLVVSTAPKDVALCERINETIERSEFSNARWGVMAVSLKDGRAVCGRDARKLFNPASIEKILTSIVALDRLGADYRWKTSAVSTEEIKDGTLDGDLILKGRGAPDFDDAALENLAAQLQAKGLKHIKGNIVGDASYFTGDDIGDGWTWNDLQWHYGAEACALTFRENQADVYLKDGAPASSTDYFHVQNELAPKQKDKPDAYGIKRGLADNEVYIWGNGDKASGQLAVHNPALWAAKNFKEFLEKKGIAVDGAAKSVDWQTKDKVDAENAIELASVESKTLAEIVQRMNKRSVNIYAELILRTLGKRFGADAPDDNKQFNEVRGDDAAGASVVEKFLRENKVAADEIQIHDGSGLSRLDFVTPEAFARALVFAAQSKFADAFENSLPIAATDGTLGGRLGRAKGKIIAKTGSITYVNSLAGYAQGADNEILAFVVICNNQTRRADATNVVDSIASSLTESEEANREKTRNETK